MPTALVGSDKEVSFRKNYFSKGKKHGCLSTIFMKESGMSKTENYWSKVCEIL